MFTISEGVPSLEQTQSDSDLLLKTERELDEKLVLASTSLAIAPNKRKAALLLTILFYFIRKGKWGKYGMEKKGMIKETKKKKEEIVLLTARHLYNARSSNSTLSKEVLHDKNKSCAD